MGGFLTDDDLEQLRHGDEENAMFPSPIPT